MPIQSCDPAARGQQYNEMDQSLFNNDVQIIALWSWDGTSQWPDCDGPIHTIQGINNSATVTYYAHFKGKSGTPHTISMPPGFNTTYTAQQAKRAGFNNYSDLDNLIIDTSPNDPSPWAVTG